MDTCESHMGKMDKFNLEELLSPLPLGRKGEGTNRSL